MILDVILLRALHGMAYRINLFAYWLAGCTISTLAAMWILIKFDLPVMSLEAFLFAFIAFATISIGFCWLAGLRDRNTLISAAVFTTLGWFAGAFGVPAVAMSRRQQLQEIISSSLAGHDWVIRNAVFAGIFLFCYLILVHSPMNKT